MTTIYTAPDNPTDPEAAALERVAFYVTDIRDRWRRGRISEHTALERVANYVADELVAQSAFPQTAAVDEIEARR